MLKPCQERPKKVAMSSPLTSNIPIARPYLEADDVEALRGALESGWVTMGPAVKEFEERVAGLLGVPALATSSCTSAMHLALMAWGIGPGDEVIVPAYSFVASAHAVAQTGATPVFCDIDPATAQIDPDSAAASVSERTRAIMPVHLFGIPAPMEEILPLAARHGLKVIEDAAGAFGASYRGAMCGAIGDAGAFSFHPRKIVTMGEGGILSSADEELLHVARAQRNHGAHISGFDRHQAGQGSYPTFGLLGYNYRLTDLQARLGLVQLDRFDEILRLRREQAAAYDEAFASLEGVEPLRVPEGGEACWQSYVLRVLPEAPLGAEELRIHLTERGIAAIQSGQVLPALDYYAQRVDWRPGAYPGAEGLDATSLTIPLFPGLSEADQERIVVAVREAWA
jgi:perosamine synthetase